MTKTKIAVLLAVMIVGIAACGKKEDVHVQENGRAVETTEDTGSVSLTNKPSEQAAELSADEIEGVSTEEGGFCIYSVHTDKTDIIIPSEVNGYPVTEIADYAFGEGKYVHISLPNSVEKVGTAAFIDCSNLAGISLGEGIKSIGHGAFVNCASLESITFPDGTETIDGFVLGGCDSLKEVYIPASVTEFGEGSRILSVGTCPNAVVITPKGSSTEAVCEEEGITFRNN